ncbi:hypothetical protein CALCODRAFT_491292, partial [Calocera cornea HHB12733]
MPLTATRFIVEFVLLCSALGTPTSPHRARQSPSPCSFYSCPPTGPGGAAITSLQLSGTGLTCRYSDLDCFYL